MTQVGQYAHPPKWLDKPNRLAPFARLYLHHVTVIDEQWIVTSGDLTVTPDPQLHPDLHRWDEWPWS